MAIGGCTLSSDDVVIKSPNDRRLYRYIQLTNGLCALLVHDPEIYSDADGSLGCHSKSSERSEAEEDYEDDDEEDEDEDKDEDGKEDEEDEEEESNLVNDKEKKGASQKKAAAAMCVGMGSFKDPYEAQGLAHFLGFCFLSGISAYRFC